MIQDGVEIVDEFSEVLRCGCKSMLAQMRALRNAMLDDGLGLPQLCKLRWLYCFQVARCHVHAPLQNYSVWFFIQERTAPKAVFHCPACLLSIISSATTKQKQN